MKQKILLQKPKLSDLFKITLILFCLYFAAGNTQSGWLFAVTAGIFSLIFVNIIISKYTISKLQLTRTIPSSPIQSGAHFSIKISVFNTSPITLNNINIKQIINEEFKLISPEAPEGDQEEMMLSISQKKSSSPLYNYVRFSAESIEPGEEISFNITLQCMKRGTYRMQETSIMSGWPLSLFQASKRIFGKSQDWQKIDPDKESENCISIYSQSIKTRSSRGSASAGAESRSLSARSSEGTICGFHDYQEGEDIRNIHWMTSARMGKPMIKEFQSFTSHKSLLIIPVFSHDGLKFTQDTLIDLWKSKEKEKAARIEVWRNSIKNIAASFLPFKTRIIGRAEEIYARKYKKTDEELSIYRKIIENCFGFEEIICCINTAFQNRIRQGAKCAVMLFNSDGKYQIINSFPQLKQAEPFWSVFDEDLCLNQETASRLHEKISEVFKDHSFTEILVLSMTPHINLHSVRKAKSFRCLFFDPSICIQTNSEKAPFYALCRAKSDQLKTEGISSHTLTLKSSPEKIAQLWL